MSVPVDIAWRDDRVSPHTTCAILALIAVFETEFC